jgi:glycosyltransferase involved in cell wall biosynthesis
LKAFDVFVLPSRTEAFPYVPLEAGLAQLPVVASKVGGIPEIITNRKNGLLVNPGDIYELKSTIKELLEDSAEAAIFGHNLRKTVEENFSIEHMVQKTLSVYNGNAKPICLEK